MKTLIIEKNMNLIAGRIVEIDDVDCEFMSVKVNACAGYCASLSFYDPVEKRIRAEGSSCCRMRDSDEVNILPG